MSNKTNRLCALPCLPRLRTVRPALSFLFVDSKCENRTKIKQNKNTTSHIGWQLGDRLLLFHCVALPPPLLPFWFRSDESPAAQAQSYNLSNPLSAWCDNVISSGSLFCRWLVSHNLYRFSPAWWIAWIRVWLLPLFFPSGCHCLELEAGCWWTKSEVTNLKCLDKKIYKKMVTDSISVMNGKQKVSGLIK